MEKRKEPRLRPHEPLLVSVLGENSQTLDGEITDMSARGVSLVLPAPVAAGSALQMEHEEFLLLGEVCYCRQEDDRWRAGILLRHSLSRLNQLRAWNRRVAMGVKPDRKSTPVTIS